MTETVSLIPADQLPANVLEGVKVGGVPVYRFRNGWSLPEPVAAALWNSTQAATPAQEGERILSVSLPSINWHGKATRAQCDAYAAAVSALVKAAKKATAPARRQKRADREAAAARRLESLGAAMRGQVGGV